MKKRSFINIRYLFMQSIFSVRALFVVLVGILSLVTGIPAQAEAPVVLSSEYIAYDRVEAAWSGRRYRQQIFAEIGAKIEEVSATEDRYSFASKTALVKSRPSEPIVLGNADGSAYGWLRNRRTGEVRGESGATWLSVEANRLLNSLDPLVLVNGAADWETQLPIFDGRLKGFGRNPVAKFHVERIDGQPEKYLVTYRIQGLAFRDAAIRSGVADIFGFGIFDHQRGLSEGFGLRYTVRVVSADGQEATINGEKLAKRRDSDLLLSQLRDAESLEPVRLLFSPGSGENVWVAGREEEAAPAWLHSATQVVGLADNFALLAGEKQTNTVWLAAMGAMRAFDQVQMYATNALGATIEKANTATEKVFGQPIYTQDSTASLWIGEMQAYNGVSDVIQQKTTEVMGDISAEVFGSRHAGEMAAELLGTAVSTGLDSVNFLGGLKKIEQGIGAAAGAKLEFFGQGIAGKVGDGVGKLAGKGYDKLHTDIQGLADDIYDLAVSRRKAVEEMQGSRTWFDRAGLPILVGSAAKGDEDAVTKQLSELPPAAHYAKSADPVEIQQYGDAFRFRPLDYGPLPDWLSKRQYPDWHTLPFVKRLLERMSKRSEETGSRQDPTAPAASTPSAAVPSLDDYRIQLGSISFSPGFWTNFGAGHSLISAWSAGDQSNVQRGWLNSWELTNFLPQGGTRLAGGMYWGTMDDTSVSRRVAVGFGPLPTAVPTTGTASFTWVGGTAPVDNYGRTGSVTNPGSLSINFATGQFTYAGLAYSIAGINYQFGQASFLPGALGLASVDVSGSLSCSNCSGFVSGRLLGAGGTGAAISSSVMGSIDGARPGSQAIGASTVQMYAR